MSGRGHFLYRAHVFSTCEAYPEHYVDALIMIGWIAARSDDVLFFVLHARVQRGEKVSRTLRKILVVRWSTYLQEFKLSCYVGCNAAQG
jgi:hypothetical protein